MSKYIVVKTLCDDKEKIQEISKILLEKHLVSGCQISKVESKYWWDEKIESCVEYLLEGRTTKLLYSDIEKQIKEIHPYQVPEISYCEIDGSKDFLNWIEKNTK